MADSQAACVDLTSQQRPERPDLPTPGLSGDRPKMAEASYQSALTNAVQMSLSALTELEGMSTATMPSPALGAPPASPARTLSDAANSRLVGDEGEEGQSVAELRRQLRQKDAKLRKLSQSHATTKRKLKEATERADAAETLVSTARDVQRRGEKATSKLDKLQKRAALAKQMMQERDEAVRDRDQSVETLEAQLQAKNEELAAWEKRVAELDAEVRRAEKEGAEKESEMLKAQAQLQVVQNQRRSEIDAIKDQAQAQWSDFQGKQTDLLKSRLEQSVADRITATAEKKIRAIAEQLLASKQELQQIHEALERAQAEIDQKTKQLDETEAAAAKAIEQAKAHAEEKAWVQVQTARAAAESERKGRQEAEARVQAAVRARAEAEVAARASTRALAKADARARQAEVTLRSMTGDVEARAQAELRALQEAEARITAERKADEMVEVLAATKGTLEAQIQEFAVEAAFAPLTPSLNAGPQTDPRSFAEPAGTEAGQWAPDQKADEIAAALARTEGVLEVMRTQVQVARDKMHRMRQLSADAGLQGAADLDALEVTEQRLQEALLKARREEEARHAAESRASEMTARLARAEATIRSLQAAGATAATNDDAAAAAAGGGGEPNALAALGGGPEQAITQAHGQPTGFASGDMVSMREAELAVGELAQEAERMLSAHAHATRAVSATNRAAMVQAVERAETEAEAKVEAVREHVTVFTKEQMGVIDVLDAEVQKLETQVEASERARVEADHRARELAIALETVHAGGA